MSPNKKQGNNKVLAHNISFFFFFLVWEKDGRGASCIFLSSGTSLSFLFFSNQTFNFELIENSHAIVRNHTSRSNDPVTHFPVVTFYETIVPCYNQDIDIDKAKTQNNLSPTDLMLAYHSHPHFLSTIFDLWWPLVCSSFLQFCYFKNCV